MSIRGNKESIQSRKMSEIVSLNTIVERLSVFHFLLSLCTHFVRAIKLRLSFQARNRRSRFFYIYYSADLK